MRLTIWLTGLVLLVCSPAAADEQAEVRAFLAAWARKMRGAKSLRVRFEQTKKLRVLRRPRTSSGTAWMVGRRLRMQIRGRDGGVELELGVDGKQARLLYPGRKRMEVYPLDASRSAPTPFPLFGGDVESLPRTHHLALKRDGDRDLLVMRPRDAKSSIAQVRIWFRDHLVCALEQTSRRGDRVVMRIKEFALDPDLSGVKLQLQVPPGTRVVRPTGK